MPRREEFELRPIAESDLDKVLEWRNSARVRAISYTDHEITPAEHRAWYERVRSSGAGACLLFSGLGRPLGVVTIGRIDRPNGTCHWGFYLGEPDSPRGAGTVMGFLALEHLFEKMGIRKVIGETFAFNEAGIRYHRKLGFVEEGRFAEHVVKNGRYADVVAFAHFRATWDRIKPQLAETCFGSGDGE